MALKPRMAGRQSHLEQIKSGVFVLFLFFFSSRSTQSPLIAESANAFFP
jgi:hypothetical protein